jgi:hypothetical protein
MIVLINSQILLSSIWQIWQDLKLGTIALVIIIIVVILSLGFINFENLFKQDVRENLARVDRLPNEILTEAEIEHLPELVRRYLKYANVIDKPKVKSIRVVFQGKMRDRGKDFFSFNSEQYNFFDEPTRLFFMKGKIAGLTVPGYHRYVNTKATMDIKLFGLFSIVRQSGEILDKTETVTLFNDMCLFAPATLIDRRIQWQEIDRHSVRATFTNGEITITAILYFNDRGQLINFRSDDRTAIADMKQYPFFTPISDYQNINSINIMSRGEAVWGYPDGDFTYGKFALKDIKYNLITND